MRYPRWNEQVVQRGYPERTRTALLCIFLRFIRHQANGGATLLTASKILLDLRG